MLADIEKLMLCILFIIVTRTVEGKRIISILLWTTRSHKPFLSFQLGQKTFTQRNCTFQNCDVKEKRHDVLNTRRYGKYDVVLFNAPDLPFDTNKYAFPPVRSAKQKYVLVSTHFPVNFFIGPDYNKIFNLTWSYRLDSDIVWPKMVIKDARGSVIGPKQAINWSFPPNKKSLSESVRDIRNFKLKNEGAMILVSHCSRTSNRDEYIRDLTYALAAQGYSVDKYYVCEETVTTGFSGLNRTVAQTTKKKNEQKNCYVLVEKGLENFRCKDLRCQTKSKAASCEMSVPSKYFFYLLFEDIIAEDFVSTLLNALQERTVPVVIGGADYTRFLPEGAYINAKYATPMQLADIMTYLIRNKQAYTAMFAWQTHYSYHAPEDSPETDPFCKFCEYVNDKKMMSQFSVLREIHAWSNDKNTSLSPSSLYKVCDFIRDIKFVTIVSSGTDHVSKRNAIRETWGQKKFMKIVFMLGLSQYETVANNIYQEYLLHEDIVQGNFLDTYRNLTYKHVMGLTWAHEFCPQAKFVLKTDDDVFVHLKVLHDLLDNGLDEDVDLITGKVWHTMPIVRDEKSQHYVSKDDYQENFYPPFCSGAVIIYSRKATSLLASAAKTTQYISVDDAYVTGILRIKLNISLTDVHQLRLAPDKIELVLSKKLKEAGMFLYGPLDLLEDEIRAVWSATEDFWTENDYNMVYYNS